MFLLNTVMKVYDFLCSFWSVAILRLQAILSEHLAPTLELASALHFLSNHTDFDII